MLKLFIKQLNNTNVGNLFCIIVNVYLCVFRWLVRQQLEVMGIIYFFLGILQTIDSLKSEKELTH